MNEIIQHKAVQHNHLVNAKFEMTTYEMRLFIMMLGQINKDDTDFKLCTIPVKSFIDTVGGNTYALVKETCNNISSKTIKIESIYQDKKGRNKRQFVTIPLMAICRYKEGESKIEAQFNDYIKPYLLNLAGNFTQADIEQLIKLKNFYSYRMYWLLKQYQSFGERTINMEDLRTLLNVEEKYLGFDNFRRYVLNIMKKDLNETDVCFDFTSVRKGKTVTAVKFVLKKPVTEESKETGQLQLPMYKRPVKKDQQTVTQIILDYEEQEKGYEISKKKGTTHHQTFEDFVAAMIAQGFSIEEQQGRKVFVKQTA